MKKAVSPAASILLVVLALGIVFAVMYFQSEAPVWNKIPQGPSVSMPAMKPGARPAVPSALDATKADAATKTSAASPSESGEAGAKGPGETPK